MSKTERMPKAGLAKTLMGVGGTASSRTPPAAQAPAAAAPAEPGAGLPDLGSRYVALRELGRGGMGTVYLAEHRDLGRRFAVKVLLPELTADKGLIERLRREARAASQIRHPGIVDVTDFGQTVDGRAYVVMEHIEGRDLADRLIEDGPFEQEEAASIALGVCRALEAAHAKGIIHRDIKPENIILAEGVPEAERVKVVDFGLALSPETGERRLTRHGTAFGTPEFMAPEQVKGRGVGPATDVYALGAVLYAMLAGSPPFEEETAVETMARKLNEPAEPPSARAPSAEIHSALERVVVTALATASWERYGSMTEMAEALERALRLIRSGAEDDEAPATFAAAVSPELDEDDAVAVASSRAAGSGLRRVAAAAGLVALGAAVASAVVLVALGGGGEGGAGPDPAGPAVATRAGSGEPSGAAARPGSGEPSGGAARPGSGEPSGGAPGTGAAGPSPGASAAEPGAGPPPAGRADGSAPAAPARTDGGTAPSPGSEPGADPAAARGDREAARDLAREGQAHLRARRLAEARRDFTEAARLDPGNVDATAGLGQLAFEEGRYDEAARRLERALRSRSGNVGYRLLLGSAYLRLGRRADAIGEWERVLALDPGNRAAERSIAAARGQ